MQRPQNEANPMTMKTCGNCGSSRTAEGSVVDATFEVRIPVYRFVLSNAVVMNATACLECGYVSLFVDPGKVQSILRDCQKTEEQ